MTETSNTNPLKSDPAPTPPPAEHAELSDQDKQMASDIGDARQLINTAQTDAEIGPLIAARGYDAAELTKGDGLQKAAQAAFNQRQLAKGAAEKATKDANDAETAAREAYADFRKIARKSFPQASDQVELGLKGKVPSDRQQFIIKATASYQAGKNAAYTAVLTKRKYAPADLDALIAALDGISKLTSQQDQAEGAASTATASRDTAHKLMMNWVREFKVNAGVALKKQPGLQRKLAL